MGFLKRWWKLLLGIAVAITVILILVFSVFIRDIVNREILHICGATFIGDAFYIFLRYLQRKLRPSLKGEFLGTNPKVLLWISGFMPCLTTFWREPYDVLFGSWAPKSTIDSAVWLAAGLICSSYKIYRIKYKD